MSPIALAARPCAAARTAEAPRLDLYAPIHKALRSFMTDTLDRIGRIDTNDAADMDAALGQLETLLAMCLNHIHHENHFMHTAIEARQPAGASRTAADHLEHFDSIDALRADVLALRRAPAAERAGLALRLYRRLALFVAENFEHMHHEETANNAVLWARYSDEELAALHERLLASIPPPESLLVARWMIPALPPADRASVLNQARAGMPGEVFAVIVEQVRPHLDAAAWAKLAPAIGMAQAPGLVDFR